jgi:hypothetical protein
VSVVAFVWPLLCLLLLESCVFVSVFASVSASLSLSVSLCSIENTFYKADSCVGITVTVGITVGIPVTVSRAPSMCVSLVEALCNVEGERERCDWVYASTFFND